ncbi:MAG: ergothioneine biosynthesis protein EgtB [Melioribacteraceae bacterium]|nr:ergothioneine biosynthesis protein EgtB [Melioribacteraceae bacterium]MCF8352987.1 ergothioneine biosynthesis protein EgtB [Melioribacteraceae bacterium]MCF8392878.1 ergothioneine biosynthesis protein EgtB [Melioribacteraceae bacterium]MCF8417828.1 ergothioneine biosynthesis protein EgtB [Melioribacteraceae bacterium]
MTETFEKAASQKYILKDKFNQIRSFSEYLAKPLEVEDYVIQSMPDVSPTKWHLAHTSWFFETFVLESVKKNYKSPFPVYNYLFNSYYVQVGERWTRNRRGLLSRPTVKDVYQYRRYIDEQMNEFFETADENLLKKMKVVLEIGFNHEQQHQELMLTDLKHVFSINPMYPVYVEKEIKFNTDIAEMKWTEFNEELYTAGYDGEDFFYDNEKPVHKTYLNGFKIANRLVTNKEYIEFIEDGGYQNTPLWLSDGFAAVESENWKAPLYWEKVEGEWFNFTLNGFRKVNPAEPVVHVSFYEAEAFAHWSVARLATEFEWERASQNLENVGNFVEQNNFHPVPLHETNGKLSQMFGDVWEWTRSDYAPYPGYKVPEGAIGEYNGKFMSGQTVLRGGSCATSESHIRNTYRNFFYPNQRWQFMGIRLAKDLI